VPPETPPPDPLLPAHDPGGGSITVHEESPVLSFLHHQGADLAVAAKGFSAQAFAENIIDLMAHPDPKISLPAHKLWLTYVKTIAEANGALGRAKITRETKDHDGNSIKESGTLTRLNTRLSSTRPPAPTDHPTREHLPPSE
jgi:hypothetical protein